MPQYQPPKNLIYQCNGPVSQSVKVNGPGGFMMPTTNSGSWVAPAPIPNAEPAPEFKPLPVVEFKEPSESAIEFVQKIEKSPELHGESHAAKVDKPAKKTYKIKNHKLKEELSN